VLFVLVTYLRLQECVSVRFPPVEKLLTLECDQEGCSLDELYLVWCEINTVKFICGKECGDGLEAPTVQVKVSKHRDHAVAECGDAFWFNEASLLRCQGQIF
jgi:hypothetical protein